MTVDEAVAKALSLIGARDYVSFAELGREIPNFTVEGDSGGHVIGIGDGVWWVASKFGWDIYLKLHNRVAFHPSTMLVYLTDGQLFQLKKPDVSCR